MKLSYKHFRQSVMRGRGIAGSGTFPLKDQFYWMAALLFFFLFLYGCGEMSNHQNSGSGQLAADGELGTSLPKQLQKHRAGLTADVQIVKDDGKVDRTVPLLIDTDTHQLSGKVDDLPTGSYTVIIRYRINGVLVATQTSTAVVTGDATSPVDFNSLIMPDEDGDSYTNLFEVLWGTDWTDSNSIPKNVLKAEADTIIRTDLDLRRNDNYGCQESIIVGTGRGGGGIPFGGADAMRSLLRFDLSATPVIPISRAILELTLFSTPFLSGSPSSTYKVDIHRIVDSGVLTPWREGEGFEGLAPAGCVHVDDASGVAWVGAGDDGGDDNNQTQPDFDPTVTASATIKQGVNVAENVIHWDITPLVQHWLDGTLANNGIMLRDITSDNLFREVLFVAREGTAVDAPRLVITP